MSTLRDQYGPDGCAQTPPWAVAHSCRVCGTAVQKTNEYVPQTCGNSLCQQADYLENVVRTTRGKKADAARRLANQVAEQARHERARRNAS